MPVVDGSNDRVSVGGERGRGRLEGRKVRVRERLVLGVVQAKRVGASSWQRFAALSRLVDVFAMLANVRIDVGDRARGGSLKKFSGADDGGWSLGADVVEEHG